MCVPVMWEETGDVAATQTWQQCRHCSNADVVPPFIKCSSVLWRNPLTFHSMWYLTPFSGQTKSTYVLMDGGIAIPFPNMISANTSTFKISPSITDGLLKAFS